MKRICLEYHPLPIFEIMITSGITTLLLILIIVTVSYKGMISNKLYQGYMFQADRILVHKEYFRLASSGFFHISWWHLALNMICLYGFGRNLEMETGPLTFLLVFFMGLLSGNLLSLYLHRNHSEYSAVGASGAINAVLFACITLAPEHGIGLIGLPFHIPGWLFGLLYLFLTMYSIRSGKSDVGHEAHLGGGVIGILIGIFLCPQGLYMNYIPILVMLIPTLVFLILIIRKPQVLMLDSLFFSREKKYFSVDDKYREERKDKQLELDELLEKISRKGLNSLSSKERQRLEELSK